MAGNTKVHDVRAVLMGAVINCSDMTLLIYVSCFTSCFTLMITGSHNPSTEITNWNGW